MAEIDEYKKIIQRILEAFKNVPFSIIVESATNTKVESIDLSDQRDSLLIAEISKLADLVATKYYKTGITRNIYMSFRGKKPRNFRPNEVSIILEYELQNVFDQNKTMFNTIIEVYHFKRTGYPDERIIDIYNRVTYLEIKATTRPGEGSPRDFYFTPLENTKIKVTNNARHLLLGFIIKETKPRVYKTVGWKLVDLSRIFVSMKPEFNADNREIYKKEAIIAERTYE